MRQIIYIPERIQPKMQIPKIVTRASRLRCLLSGYSFSRSAHNEAVGFVGLGNMGEKMAENLLNKGEKLIVYDTQAKAREKFSSKPNVTVAKSVKELANESSLVITMLPTCEIVRSVYMSDDGIFKNCHSSDAVFIDSSTVHPATAQELSRMAHATNRLFLDAPVSGGVVGAKNATLAFMIGGCDSVPKNVETLLLKMGARAVHCGPSGMGQVAKLCNNMLLGATMVAVAETFNTALKCGMDAKILTSIVNSSTGRCWVTEVNNPIPETLETAPSSRNYEGGFKTNLLIKDLNLGLDMARSKNLDLTLIRKALELYEDVTVKDAKAGDLDFSVIYRMLSEKHK